MTPLFLNKYLKTIDKPINISRSLNYIPKNPLGNSVKKPIWINDNPGLEFVVFSYLY